MAVELSPDTVFAILAAVRSAGPEGCTIDALVRGLWPNGRPRRNRPPVPRHKLPGGAGQMAQQCVNGGLLVKFGGRAQGHIRYRLTRAGETQYARQVAELDAAAGEVEEKPTPAAGEDFDDAQGWSR